MPWRTWEFPDSSIGKESCKAGDSGSIPGLRRSAGEGIGYPYQYSWATLVIQLVKNPPAMREIWVQSLGWEDPLEKGTSTYSSILAWRIPWTVWSMRSQRVGHDWATFTFTKNVWWGFWERFYDHLKSVVLKLTWSKATQKCDFSPAVINCTHADWWFCPTNDEFFLDEQIKGQWRMFEKVWW